MPEDKNPTQTASSTGKDDDIVEVTVWMAYLEGDSTHGTSESRGSSPPSSTSDGRPTEKRPQRPTGSRPSTSPEPAPAGHLSGDDTDKGQDHHHTGPPLAISPTTQHSNNNKGDQQSPPATPHARVSELQSELTRQSGIRRRGHELAARALRIASKAGERVAAGRKMEAEGQALAEYGRRGLRLARGIERRGLSYIQIAEREERRVRLELLREDGGVGAVGDKDWAVSRGSAGCRAVGDVPAPWMAEEATVPDEVMRAWRRKIRRNKE